MENKNTEQNLRMQKLIALIGQERTPFIETGRKYDRIIVEGEVRYFVVRYDVSETVKSGDIFGAKSKLAPNFRWYFGNLENVDKWDWSGYHGVPVSDASVVQSKGYGSYKHYQKI